MVLPSLLGGYEEERKVRQRKSLGWMRPLRRFLLSYSVLCSVLSHQEGRFPATLLNQCVWQLNCLLRYPYIVEHRKSLEEIAELERLFAGADGLSRQSVSNNNSGRSCSRSQSSQEQVTSTYVGLLLATRLFNFLELGALLYYFNDNAGQQETPMSNSHHEIPFLSQTSSVCEDQNPARRKAQMQQASQCERQDTRPEKQNKQLA